MNNGFATLRQHIPGHVAQGYGDRGKKLSKVETLRMAVEYIRGLQRLLAEADGLDYDANQSQLRSDDSSIMIPSPTGSGYSGSGTHNGSGDVMGLTGSELDEQHGDMDDVNDAEAYGLEDEDDLEDKKDAKRFKEDVRIQNRYELKIVGFLGFSVRRMRGGFFYDVICKNKWWKSIQKTNISLEVGFKYQPG